MDIVELLKNLNVEWHQEPIINLAAEEIEQLREDLKDQKGKTIAAYKREAKWIENVSNAKVEIERLQNERDLFKGIWQRSTELDPVSYTHLRCRRIERCRSRWSPYH